MEWFLEKNIKNGAGAVISMAGQRGWDGAWRHSVTLRLRYKCPRNGAGRAWGTRQGG